MPPVGLGNVSDRDDSPCAPRALRGQRGTERNAKRTIGIDIGVTSDSRVAVAEGATILSNWRVGTSPDALTSAISLASGGQPVDIVVESTAMSWFVAAVAAEHADVEHTLHRVSGRKAAALRSFYRVHTKTDRIDAPVLARMPLVDDGLQEFTQPTASEGALKRLVTYPHRLEKDAKKAVSRVRSLLHCVAPQLLQVAGGTSDVLLRVLRRWTDPPSSPAAVVNRFLRHAR